MLPLLRKDKPLGAHRIVVPIGLSAWHPLPFPTWQPHRRRKWRAMMRIPPGSVTFWCRYRHNRTRPLQHVVVIASSLTDAHADGVIVPVHVFGLLGPPPPKVAAEVAHPLMQIEDDASGRRSKSPRQLGRPNEMAEGVTRSVDARRKAGFGCGVLCRGYREFLAPVIVWWDGGGQGGTGIPSSLSCGVSLVFGA